MSQKYLEENRYLYIESKLGPNKLLLESFTGSEGISQLFCFQLELLSENKRIKFEDILGQEISFGVAGMEEGELPRCVHGIVTAFAQLPDTSRLSRYRAVVSPKSWIDSEAELPDFPKPHRPRHTQKGTCGFGTSRGNCRALTNPANTACSIANQISTSYPGSWRRKASFIFSGSRRKRTSW